MLQPNTKTNNILDLSDESNSQARRQICSNLRKMRKRMEQCYGSDEFDYSEHIVSVNGKRPLGKEWQKKSTSDGKVRNDLLNGVASGYGLKPNYKFIFLDCDGQEAIDLVDSWCVTDEITQIVNTTIAQTSGKEGRKTYMFCATESAIEKLTKVQESKIIVPCGDKKQLEVFYGNNHQCVGYGSIHPDTMQPYQAINSPVEHTFEPIPDEIVDEICKRAKPVKKTHTKTTAKKQTTSTSSTNYIAKAINELNDPVFDLYANIEHQFNYHKDGKALQGYCPNPNCQHDNDTGRTFNVNIDRDDDNYLTWYCFGCGIGGNAIHYEKFCHDGEIEDMKQDREVYKDWVKRLETRLGIQFEQASFPINYYRPDDFGTIERCITRWMQSLNFIVVNDEFYQYSGKGFWQLIPNPEIKSIIASHLDKCYKEENEKKSSDESDGDKKQQKNTRTRNGKRTKAPTEEQETKQKENKKQKNKVYNFATERNLTKSFKYVKSTLNKGMSLPSNKHLICFANGTYDIKLGKLCEHSKDDYLFWQIPFDFNPDDNEPQKFLEFLDSAVGQHQIKIVQAFTRSLIDVSSPFGKFAHLIGQSGSGKGTLLRVWSSLFSEFNCTAQSSLSILNDPDKRHQYLTDTRFFYAPDVKGYIQGLEAFYELVDNGKLSGRKLHSSDSYNKQWDCRFALASVKPLKIESSGDGWHRRCLPISFNSKPSNPDYFLGQKLEQELGKIVSWALSMSYEEMIEVLFNSHSQTQQDLQNEQLISSDSVAGFINAMLLPADKALEQNLIDEIDVENDSGNYTPDDLFDFYKSYCDYIGVGAKSRNNFTHSMRSLIPDYYVPRKQKRSNGKRVNVSAHFKGIIVNTNAVNKEWKLMPKQCWDYGLDVFEGKPIPINDDDDDDPSTAHPITYQEMEQLIIENEDNKERLLELKKLIKEGNVTLTAEERQDLIEFVTDAIKLLRE